MGSPARSATDVPPLSSVLCPPGEADSGDGGSGGRRHRERRLSRPEGQGLSAGQPAGASAVGGGHGRATDVHRTHPAHRDVPLAQAGLGVVQGGGQ